MSLYGMMMGLGAPAAGSGVLSCGEKTNVHRCRSCFTDTEWGLIYSPDPQHPEKLQLGKRPQHYYEGAVNCLMGRASAGVGTCESIVRVVEGLNQCPTFTGKLYLLAEAERTTGQKNQLLTAINAYNLVRASVLRKLAEGKAPGSPGVPPYAGYVLKVQGGAAAWAASEQATAQESTQQGTASGGGTSAGGGGTAPAPGRYTEYGTGESWAGGPAQAPAKGPGAAFYGGLALLAYAAYLFAQEQQQGGRAKP